MPDDTRNVFISHIHEDDEGLTRIKNLTQKHGMTLRDASITADKPNAASNPGYIKSSGTSTSYQVGRVLLVYVSPDTKYSEWVDWEIEYAHKLGRGSWAYGNSGPRTVNCQSLLTDMVMQLLVGTARASLMP